MDIKHEVARSLLSIEAVFLRPQEPFTWASGIKSPIYCDNRLILTAPEARDLVERAIAETVRREYPQAQVLMGTATAGIAHAAIAAHLLGLFFPLVLRTDHEEIHHRHEGNNHNHTFHSSRFSFSVEIRMYLLYQS